MIKDSVLKLVFKEKKHKIYSLKINKAEFIKELRHFVFLRDKEVKSNVITTKKGISIKYMDNNFFSFIRLKNIKYSYVIIKYNYFIEEYEKFFDGRDFYYDKFNYLHWVYKILKKMERNFLRDLNKNLDETSLHFNSSILAVIERTDKNFVYFKLKQESDVFKKFKEKKEEKDAIFLSVSGRKYSKGKDYEFYKRLEEREKQVVLDKIKNSYSFIDYIVIRVLEGNAIQNFRIDKTNLSLDDVLQTVQNYMEKYLELLKTLQICLFVERKAIFGIGYKHEKTGDFLGFFIFHKVVDDNYLDFFSDKQKIIKHINSGFSNYFYQILDLNDIEIIEE